MENRIQRINQLLKKEVGRILIREVDLGDSLTTITQVDTSSNLQEARIYISAIPFSEIDKILAILNKEIYKIQQELNKRLRMRPVPKIIFKKDEITKKADQIEALLEKIKQEGNN